MTTLLLLVLIRPYGKCNKIHSLMRQKNWKQKKTHLGIESVITEFFSNIFLKLMKSSFFVSLIVERYIVNRQLYVAV